MRASVLLCGVAVTASAARAETPRDTPAAIDVDRETAPAGRAELGFDAGAPVEGWAASVQLGWLERPIVLRAPSGESHPVARRTTLALGAAIGLGPSVVLDARLPLARQAGDRLAILGDPSALDRWVPGDLRFGGRVRVVATRRAAAFVRGELSLPTGDDHDFAGEPSWSGSWRLIARVSLPAGIVAAASGGILLRGAEVRIGDRIVGDELHGAVGVVVPLPPIHPLWCAREQVQLTGELVSILGDHVAGVRGPSPVEARVGLVTRPRSEVSLGVRIGAGLGDQIGAPAWRATVELTYHGRQQLIPPAGPSAPGDADTANDDDDAP